MREYVKPVLDLVVLRVEERFAGSTCSVTGSCSEAEQQAMAALGLIVNFN